MALPLHPPPALYHVASSLVKNKQHFVDTEKLWAHMSKTANITEPEVQFALGSCSTPVSDCTLEEIHLDNASGVCAVDKNTAFEVMREFTQRYTAHGRGITTSSARERGRPAAGEAAGRHAR